MLLQQLVVELHHLLVLCELQHALAQVESQRETHFFQRLPVVRLLVHLRRAGRGEEEMSWRRQSDIERGGIKYVGGGGKGQRFLKMSTGGRGRWDREKCCGVKGTKTSDSQVWREGKSLGKRKGKRTGGCSHSDNTVDSGYF